MATASGAPGLQLKRSGTSRLCTWRATRMRLISTLSSREKALMLLTGKGGPAPVLRTEQIRSTSPSWVGWTGKWGDSEDSLSGASVESPRGPGHGGNTEGWNHPGLWTDDLPPCE